MRSYILENENKENKNPFETLAKTIEVPASFNGFHEGTLKWLTSRRQHFKWLLIILLREAENEFSIAEFSFYLGNSENGYLYH